MTFEAAAQALLDQGVKSAIAQHSTHAIYRDDSFRMYAYKVVQCSKRYGHDWTECPFAHPGEKAQRRCPRKYSYLGIACPDVKRASECPRGDKCCFAHNVFEYWLHPTRYRTQLCSYGANCRRSVCFFAHSIQELRVPTCEKVINPSGITQETAQQLSTGDAALALQYAQATGLHDLTSQLLRSTNLSSQLAQVQAAQFDSNGGAGGGRQLQGQMPMMGGGDMSLLSALQALQAQSHAQSQAGMWQQPNAVALAAAMAAQQQQAASSMSLMSPGRSLGSPSLSSVDLPGGSEASSLEQVDLQAYLMAQAQLQQLQQGQGQGAAALRAHADDLSAQLSLIINKLDNTQLGAMDASALLSMQQQAQAQQQLMAAASTSMQGVGGNSGAVMDVPTPPIYESVPRNQANAH